LSSTDVVHIRHDTGRTGETRNHTGLSGLSRGAVPPPTGLHRHDLGGAPYVPAGAAAPAETVPISVVRPPVDSPRLDGEDLEHVQALAESDAELPPILVNRRGMRVIDGAHRLRAAALRGAETVKVVYFDGDQEAAFVAAVEANTRHGLPLSLADRKAAAARIIASHPHWSDRAIARITALAATTVGSMRPTDGSEQLGTRVGRDGRLRPLDGSDGRRRAAEAIKARPDASLREIARMAGVSPTTAGSVRDRLKQGADPLEEGSPPDRRSTATASKQPGNVLPAQSLDPAAILHSLRRDPSLRYTDVGRTLLRLLDLQIRGPVECRRSMARIPRHCAYPLVELAQALASSWLDLAKELEQSTSQAAE
jgi:ParB-like chromosome segregation protein Spo0J